MLYNNNTLFYFQKGKAISILGKKNRKILPGKSSECLGINLLFVNLKKTPSNTGVLY